MVGWVAVGLMSRWVDGLKDRSLGRRVDGSQERWTHGSTVASWTYRLTCTCVVGSLGRRSEGSMGRWIVWRMAHWFGAVLAPGIDGVIDGAMERKMHRSRHRRLEWTWCDLCDHLAITFSRSGGHFGSLGGHFGSLGGPFGGHFGPFLYKKTHCCKKAR